ncbi:MAG: hypothetical protein Q9228_007692 [Teloschistes exilis]
MTNEQDRRRFVFSSNWFELIEHEWETRTEGLRDKKLNALEIGSFEGGSTTWILDRLMNHPASTMVAIDTFEGGMEHQGQDGSAFPLSSLEQRFRQNVSMCQHHAKLQVLKMRSDEGLMQLLREKRRFDLIYVDASHVAIDVLQDAVVCWRLLKVGGMLVFDDYSWKGYLEDCYNPRVAIESFIKCAAPEIETEETESQLWVRKVANHIPATPNPDPYLYDWEKGLAKRPEK